MESNNNSNNNNIEYLLEAYFEGETSLAQEQKLREYFMGDAVAPHLERYIPMFTAFAKAGEERYTGEINLPKPKNFRPYLSIAAGVFVLVGLFLFFNNNNNNNIVDYGTYKDPEVAALKTKQTLMMMGSFINQGAAQVEKLDEFEKTKEKFVKDEGTQD